MLPNEPKPVWWQALVGAAFMVIGALILVPSGLCTAFVGIMALVELFTSPHDLWVNAGDIWPYLVSVLGAVALGVFLLRLGLYIGRR